MSHLLSSWVSYTANFVSFRQDIDATPWLKGLPDDRCQCPHWGYVITGKLTMRFADQEEVFEPATLGTRHPAMFRSSMNPAPRSCSSALPNSWRRHKQS